MQSAVAFPRYQKSRNLSAKTLFAKVADAFRVNTFATALA